MRSDRRIHFQCTEEKAADFIYCTEVAMEDSIDGKQWKKTNDHPGVPHRIMSAKVKTTQMPGGKIGIRFTYTYRLPSAKTNYPEQTLEDDLTAAPVPLSNQ